MHNQMSDSNHLAIPSRFRAFRSAIVVWFWRDMEWDQAAFLTVLIGAILSLIIETSQIALPTRTPSSLDLLCNTAGAVLGIILLRIIFIAQNKTEKNRLQEHYVR